MPATPRKPKAPQDSSLGGEDKVDAFAVPSPSEEGRNLFASPTRTYHANYEFLAEAGNLLDGLNE